MRIERKARVYMVISLISLILCLPPSPAGYASVLHVYGSGHAGRGRAANREPSIHAQVLCSGDGEAR